MIDRHRYVMQNPYIYIVGFLATLLSFFSELKSLVLSVFSKLTGLPTQVGEFLYFIVSFIFFIFLLALVASRRGPKPLLVSQSDGGISVFPMGDNNRIHLFQRLRESAQSDIIVMGVGMSYFSSDLRRLSALLDKGIHVRLLMLDPSVFQKEHIGQQIWLGRELFDSYFDRRNHSADISQSLDRLTDFARRYSSGTTPQGQIEIRTYSVFIPINFTAIDTRTDGKIVIEAALPFSEYRVNIEKSQHDDPDGFKMVLESCENLWRNSKIR